MRCGQQMLGDVRRFPLRISPTGYENPVSHTLLLRAQGGVSSLQQAYSRIFQN